MVFNSLTFMLFFMVVLLLHHLPLSWKVKKGQLVVASYLFYAAWNPPFVILLWISTLTDWYAARAIQRARRPAFKRLFLILSIETNLFTLYALLGGSHGNWPNFNLATTSEYAVLSVTVGHWKRLAVKISF